MLTEYIQLLLFEAETSNPVLLSVRTLLIPFVDLVIQILQSGIHDAYHKKIENQDRKIKRSRKVFRLGKNSLNAGQ